MTEVPGLTRAMLASLDSSDVEAIRWSIYVRALRPVVTSGPRIEQRIRDLVDIDSPPSEATQRARRAEEREQLAQARNEVARLRSDLLLDDDPEDLAEAVA